MDALIDARPEAPGVLVPELGCVLEANGKRDVGRNASGDCGREFATEVVVDAQVAIMEGIVWSSQAIRRWWQGGDSTYKENANETYARYANAEFWCFRFGFSQFDERFWN